VTHDAGGLLRHGPALQLTEHVNGTSRPTSASTSARGSNQSRSQCSDSKAGAPAGSRQINALAPGRTASRQMRAFSVQGCDALLCSLADRMWDRSRVAEVPDYAKVSLITER
jgi:hypothetical protein